MTHKTATGAYTPEQRAHRDAERAAKRRAARRSMQVQNAQAKKDYTPGAGAENYVHKENDAGREATGKRNRPCNTGYTREHLRAMEKAGVGPND